MSIFNNLKHIIMMRFNSNYERNHIEKELQAELDSLRKQADYINSSPLSTSSFSSQLMEESTSSVHLDKKKKTRENLIKSCANSYTLGPVPSESSIGLKISPSLQNHEKCAEPLTSTNHSHNSDISYSSDSSGGSSSCD